MRSRRVAIAVGVAALLVAGGVAVQRNAMHPSSEARDSDSAGTAMTSNSRASAPVTASARRAAASYVLPPQDVPLAAVLPGLEAAARAGNLSAKCRLAFELRRCGPERMWSGDYYAEVADEVLYSDTPASDYRLKEHARGEEKMAEYERICRGVGAPRELEPWRLWREAAKAGHVPSMLRFANYLPWTSTANEDLEALAAWRDESIGFLQRAAEAGDGWAAYELFWGYSGNAGFPTYHAQDDRKALVYALALRGAGEAETLKNLSDGAAKLRRRLSAADVQAAEREAALLAPGLARFVGAQVDLRIPRDKAAEDCGFPDPRARPLPEPKREAVS